MRAREAASAWLDGELSELETAQLHGHLRDCEDCEAYALEVGAFTTEPAGRGARTARAPVFAARRRRPALRLNVAVAAVTILAATGSSFAVGHLLGSSSGTPAATIGTSGSGVSPAAAERGARDAPAPPAGPARERPGHSGLSWPPSIFTPP